MARLAYNAQGRSRFSNLAITGAGGGGGGGGGGGISYVGSNHRTASGSGTTSWSVPYPIDAAIGDLVVVCLMYVLDQTVSSSNFTKIGTRTTGVGSSFLEIWYRFMQSGDTQADFTSSGTVVVGATSHCWENVDSIGPNTNKGSATNSGQADVPTFNTTVDDAKAVYFAAGDNGDVSRIFDESQSGLDFHYRINSAAGTYLQHGVWSKTMATAGATGAQTLTASGLCNRHGFGIELIPA